jgi:sulfur-carrier protein
MIEVKYFGAVAEKTACNLERFDFSDLPLSSFIDRINAKHNLESIPYSIAVNKKIIDQENYILKDDDVVAFLPPFAGG